MTWIARDPVERFWSNVDKNGPLPERNPELGSCWVYQGYLNNGYARFYLNQEVYYLAHRYAYALEGELTTAEELDHLCRNRACVRRSHLEIVSHRENTLRGDTIAARNAAKTHCPAGHLYSGDNLVISRDGSRECKACSTNRNRRRRALIASDPVALEQRRARDREYQRARRGRLAAASTATVPSGRSNDEEAA